MPSNARDEGSVAAYKAGNHCKVEGCEEPFAYDHRCERHTDLDERHGALYRLLAVGCPECGRRFTVPTGRGRNRIRQMLDAHLIEDHGWRPEASSDLALRFVPRLAEGAQDA